MIQPSTRERTWNYLTVIEMRGWLYIYLHMSIYQMFLFISSSTPPHPYTTHTYARLAGNCQISMQSSRKGCSDTVKMIFRNDLPNIRLAHSDFIPLHVYIKIYFSVTTNLFRNDIYEPEYTYANFTMQSKLSTLSLKYNSLYINYYVCITNMK